MQIPMITSDFSIPLLGLCLSAEIVQFAARICKHGGKIMTVCRSSEEIGWGTTRATRLDDKFGNFNVKVGV